MSIIERFARADDPYALHDVTAARAEHLRWRGDAQEAHRIARESLSHLADEQDFGLVVEHVQRGAARPRRSGHHPSRSRLE